MFFRLKPSKFITGFIVTDRDHVPQKGIYLILHLCAVFVRFHQGCFVFQNSIHILICFRHHKSFDETCRINLCIIQYNFFIRVKILNINTPRTIISAQHGCKLRFQRVHPEIIKSGHLTCRIHRKTIFSYSGFLKQCTVWSSKIICSGKHLSVRCHFQIMCPCFRHHLSILIKIIISVICCIIDHVIADIPNLWSCCQFSKVIDHIIAVKIHRLCIFIGTFCTGKLRDFYHVGTSCLKTSSLIMVIKSVQHRSINIHMIKIMNSRRDILTPIFFQAVKSITF